MNEARVHLAYLRLAPRKVRLVADLIRGKRVSEAETLLRFAVKRPAHPLAKLLQSAVSAALQKGAKDAGALVISRIVVDEGPKLKRAMPRAQGRSYAIQKKTSHVSLVLREAPAQKESIAAKNETKETKKPVKKTAEKKA